MLLELVMGATMLSGRAAPGEAREGVAAAAVQGEPQPRSAPDAIEVAACERALHEELARPGCSAAAVAERLQGLGFPPLEPAWDLLWSAERRGPMASAFARARVSHLDVLERLALAAPPAGVRRSLALRIAGEPSAPEVLWIAAYLGQHGSWREVDLSLALLRVDGPWLGLDPEQVRDTVTATLTAILVRDPEAYAALRSTVEAAPESFGQAALDALARTAGDRALATLAELLDGRKLDAARVVGVVEAVGRRSLPPFDAFLVQRLRELAVEEDPRLRAAALRAAGALADDDSLPLQIAGLRFESGTVRSAAGAALAELTGLRFGSDAQRWLSWYGGESEWWDGEGPAALERLTDPDPAVVVAALAEIVTHRLHRDRSARAIAALLEDGSPDLRRLACMTLGELGARIVAPAVVERLADVDESVRESAQRCLQGLFGAELPPEVEAWKTHLERSDLVLR